MKIGRPRQFKWLRWVIAFIFLLNAVDGALTVIWVLTGKAEEANPLMAELIDIEPVFFMVAKLLLVALGSFLLWRFRRQRAAVIGLFVLFIAYYFILVWHFKAIASIYFPL